LLIKKTFLEQFWRLCKHWNRTGNVSGKLETP